MNLKTSASKNLNNLKIRRQRNLTTTTELLDNNLNKSSYCSDKENDGEKAIRLHLDNNYFDNFLKSLEDINKYLDRKLDGKKINSYNNQSRNDNKFDEIRVEQKSLHKKTRRHYTQPVILHENNNNTKESTITTHHYHHHPKL